MTDYDYQVLGDGEVKVLDELQGLIGGRNAAKGFHNEGFDLTDALRGAQLGGNPSEIATAQSNIRNHDMMAASLITTEVAELLEELRKGKSATETYYVGDSKKPEGVPSELADIVIRAFDFAARKGINLAQILDEKLDYNASRPFMHGKKN